MPDPAQLLETAEPTTTASEEGEPEITYITITDRW